MAPIGRLVLLFLPLALIGVMADTPIKNLINTLNSATCDAFQLGIPIVCSASAGKISRSFVAEMTLNLTLSGGLPVPLPPSDMSSSKKSAFCKAAYAYADCLTKQMCIEPVCTTDEALAYIDAVKKDIKSAFGSHGVCQGKGHRSKLGCGDGNDFRALLDKCANKIKASSAPCVLKGVKKAQGKDDLCKPAYYATDCVLQDYCGACDAKVAALAVKVAAFNVNFLYTNACTAAKTPSALKCRNSGLLALWIVLGVLGLLALCGLGFYFAYFYGAPPKKTASAPRHASKSSHRRGKSSDLRKKSSKHRGHSKHRAHSKKRH